MKIKRHPSSFYESQNLNDSKSLEKLANMVLTENQYSLYVDDDYYIDHTSIASNIRIEDTNSESFFIIKNTLNSIPVDILIINDGHCGPQCAEVLREHLDHYLMYHLYEIIINMPEDLSIDPFSHQLIIREALIAAFEALDNDILNALKNPINEYKDSLALPAFSGSVTIVVIKSGKHCYTVNLGDCRAILASRSEDEKSTPIVLSTDLDCKNKKERQRLFDEHPGESIFIKGMKNRILAYLEPTRAFGNALLKLSIQDIRVIEAAYLQQNKPIFGWDKFEDMPHAQNYKTPPYISVIPDITYHEIDEKKTQFLIMASDGLWTKCKNLDAVNIVSEYLQAKNEVIFNSASFLCRQVLLPKRKSTHESLIKKISQNFMAGPHISRSKRDDMTITILVFDKTIQKDKKNTKVVIRESWDNSKFQDYLTKVNKQKIDSLFFLRW